MKTGIFGAVCLLVLAFTIAECGLSQEKRQTGCTPDSDLQDCIRRIGLITPQTASDNAFCNECRDELIDYAERCSPSVVDSYKETFNRICSNEGDQTPDNNDNDDDDDNDEGSGATAIAGATIFSTISALLVAVASAMN